MGGKKLRVFSFQFSVKSADDEVEEVPGESSGARWNHAKREPEGDGRGADQQ